jgi:hypothetical protein
MDDQLRSLAERLERAEYHVRVLLTLLMITVVGLSILVWAKSGVAPDEASKVKAPFCVVDDGGRPLLSVEGFDNGTARLALFNRGRRLRTALLATEKGGLICVLGSAGKTTAAVAGDEGGGHFRLCDNAGRLLPR